MTLRRGPVGVVALVSVLAAAVAVFVLQRSDDGPSLQDLLEGAPRVPDAAGVVAEVDASGVVLAGGRSLGFGPDTIIVSSYTLDPVRPRPNMFAHLGLKGDTVVWMSILGVVVRADPPFVSYTATIDRVEDGVVFFDDGTVLPVAVDVIGWPGFAVASIDPITGSIVSIEQQAVTPATPGSP